MGTVRIDALDVDVDTLTHARTLQRRALVVSRTHHNCALAEGRFGVLNCAIRGIPADSGNKPEGLFEEAQGACWISVAEVGIHRRCYGVTSSRASELGPAASHLFVRCVLASTSPVAVKPP